METRHPAGDHLVVNFWWSVSLQSYHGLKSQDLEILWSIFKVFFEKTTPYGKILKILFWKFTWWHKLMLLSSNVMKFVEQEIGEIVSYSHDKKKKKNKISASSQTVATAH